MKLKQDQVNAIKRLHEWTSAALQNNEALGQQMSIAHDGLASILKDAESAMELQESKTKEDQWQLDAIAGTVRSAASITKLLEGRHMLAWRALYSNLDRLKSHYSND